MMEFWLLYDYQLLIIWLLMGYAAAIHSIFLIHKKLTRLYPNTGLKFSDCFALDPVGNVLFILLGTFSGPITILANLILFWREMFK